MIKTDGNRQVQSDTGALFRESIRTLRTNLLLQSGKQANCFVVTSAGPREGKSTLAVNLACSLASLDKSVLLIDADLRKPNLHSMLGVSNQFGFSELLRGSDLGAVQQQVRKNLTLVTAGLVPADPQQLLDSERLACAMTLLKDRFDFTILDSAPLLAVADTPLLAAQTHGALLVLRYGVSREKEALLAKQRLEAAGARVIGCVLNGFDSTMSVSMYPYAKQYSSPPIAEPLTKKAAAGSLLLGIREGDS